ncbi:hypothetical protein C8Q74DRAFT_782424 [Fomes fomentarius]|nr:hypothetical protein C8Q74DRAFT_782424 [Fomes fomentarius]
MYGRRKELHAWAMFVWQRRAEYILCVQLPTIYDGNIIRIRRRSRDIDGQWCCEFILRPSMAFMHRLALLAPVWGTPGSEVQVQVQVVILASTRAVENMNVSGERAGKWMVAGREWEEEGEISRVVSMGISNLPVSPSQRCGMRPRANQLQARKRRRAGSSRLSIPSLPSLRLFSVLKVRRPVFFQRPSLAHLSSSTTVTSGCPVAPLDHSHSFRHRPTRPPAGFQLRQ